MRKPILLTHTSYLFFSGILFLTLASYSVSAQQIPNGFNYQAVIRNGMGLPVVSKTVKLRIAIIQTSSTGAVVYQEEHTTVTNAFGIVNLIVGSGLKTDGTVEFENIPWGEAAFYVKISLNADNKWIEMGTAQLQSVPYALASKYSQSIGKYKLTDAEPADNQFLKYNADTKIWEFESITFAGTGSLSTLASVFPISISGSSASPLISIPPAQALQSGYLLANDWNVFNQKQIKLIAGNNIVINGNTISGAGSTVTNVNTSGVTIVGNTLVIGTASGTTFGLLAPQDWNNFNNKQNQLVAGSNISIVGNTITGSGAGLPLVSFTPGISILGNNLSINSASNTSNGLLTAIDWTTFNNKLSQKPTIVGLGNITVSGVYPSYSIAGASNAVTNVNNANGVTISGNTLTIATASGTSFGLLSPQDWTTFNNKLSQKPTIVGLGNITVSGVYPVYSIDGTSNAVTNVNNANGVTISGNTLTIGTASGSSFGLLSPQDWTTFNNKLSQKPTIVGLGNISVSGVYPVYSIAGNNLIAGNGISISGGNTIINSSPDKILTLTGSGATSILGIYPNYNILVPQVSISGSAGVTVTGSSPSFSIAFTNGGPAGSFGNGRVATILGVITNFGNDLVNSNLTINESDGEILIYQFNLPTIKKIRPSTIIEIEMSAPAFLDDIKQAAIATFRVAVAGNAATWGGRGYLSDNGKQNYSPIFIKGYFDNINAGTALSISIYLSAGGGSGQIKIKDTTNILNAINAGGYILIRETY